MKKFKVKSFCKINVSLRVLKKLKNGYHSIQSLIFFCNIFDLILIKQIKGSKDKIKFYGRFKKGINNKFNTITKLLYLLRKHKLIEGKYFSIKIKKNVPHGSGLGGGSSNAATLLKFINSKMNLRLNNKEMENIGYKIGSDVPLFLKKKNALLTGKKNEIKRLQKKLALNVLIVYPNITCSTKKIYNKNRNFSLQLSKSVFNFKNKRILINFLKTEKNDLQKPAIFFYPKIKSLLNELCMIKGCYFSRITGSGSACVAIFSNMSRAFAAQRLIKLKYPKYWSFVSKTI